MGRYTRCWRYRYKNEYSRVFRGIHNLFSAWQDNRISAVKRVCVCHMEVHIWPFSPGRKELLKSFHMESFLVNLLRYNLRTIKWINSTVV